MVLCRIEHRPPRLDMENYPHLPLAEVRMTQASDYSLLLVETGIPGKRSLLAGVVEVGA